MGFSVEHYAIMKAKKSVEWHKIWAMALCIWRIDIIRRRKFLLERITSKEIDRLRISVSVFRSFRGVIEFCCLALSSTDDAFGMCRLNFLSMLTVHLVRLYFIYFLLSNLLEHCDDDIATIFRAIYPLNSRLFFNIKEKALQKFAFLNIWKTCQRSFDIRSTNLFLQFSKAIRFQFCIAPPSAFYYFSMQFWEK